MRRLDDVDGLDADARPEQSDQNAGSESLLVVRAARQITCEQPLFVDQTPERKRQHEGKRENLSRLLMVTSHLLSAADGSWSRTCLLAAAGGADFSKTRCDDLS